LRIRLVGKQILSMHLRVRPLWPEAATPTLWHRLVPAPLPEPLGAIFKDKEAFAVLEATLPLPFVARTCAHAATQASWSAATFLTRVDECIARVQK
jgi:hypothetical protein